MILDPAIAPLCRSLEGVLHHSICTALALGAGKTSAAYRLTLSNGDAAILRIVRQDTERPVSYRSEFRILRSLLQCGSPVPRPITSSFEDQNNVQLNHGPWSLLAPAVGEPLSRGPLSPNVARELGHFVKNLHQLPTSGYGRLFEEDNGFTGQDRCPIDGARNRWRWASSLFPLDGHELSGQPIALAAPDLVERLTDISEPILDIIRQERAVINHSDLSGEHIFISGDSLSAVIDFGSSFIGASAWEFNTLAYYHGWKTLGIILQGYSADHNTRQLLLTKSRYLAVALGIYKFHKALTQKRKGSKIRRRLQFVRDALATIHG